MSPYLKQILDYLKSMLGEGTDVSAMRIMAFISLLTGCGLAFTGMQEGKDLSQLATLVGVFVGAAFGGKVVQKFAEIKNSKGDQ